MAPSSATLLAELEADEWDLDQNLRQIQRFIQTLKTASPGDVADAYSRRDERTSPVEISSVEKGSFASSARRTPQQPPKQSQSNVVAALAWLVMSIGLMGFLCGAVLLGWSYFGGQEQLWPMGLPIALVGQVALLFGFIMQLDRVRLDNTQAVEKLEVVDERILDLKHATELLGTTRGSASQAFYAHMAERASPHILLADLKGQLDLLATRLIKG